MSAMVKWFGHAPRVLHRRALPILNRKPMNGSKRNSACEPRCCESCRSVTVSSVYRLVEDLVSRLSGLRPSVTGLDRTAPHCCYCRYAPEFPDLILQWDLDLQGPL
ncbi:hypothetical protein ElyMa_003529300 [Elysia marginata]|uniref:Uncharacterized protein n=1 Tax=Elysia marginata TaxID=1093978 RepID=A0AAV4EHB1_9GAST|nr:hypothetical protein ElyMa_003529300 [Elysia marginata]